MILIIPAIITIALMIIQMTIPEMMITMTETVVVL